MIKDTLTMRIMTKWLIMLCLLLVGRSIHAQAIGTVTYEYSDPQGTPLAEANANRKITATFDYTPYGSTALGSPPNGPGYTGHVNDPETNLVYMQARYYDPATGRFLSVDPIDPDDGDISSFNRYAYTSNNPTTFIDPDGQDSCRTDNQTNPSDPGCAGRASQPGETTGQPNSIRTPLAQTGQRPSARLAKTLAAVSVTAGRLSTEQIPWWRLVRSLLPEAVGANVAIPIMWAIPGNLDAPACEMPGAPACGTIVFSKGGKQNVRDTGLIGVSDEEIERRLKDRSTSGEEKKRLQKEQKGRKIRNKNKRQP